MLPMAAVADAIAALMLETVPITVPFSAVNDTSDAVMVRVRPSLDPTLGVCCASAVVQCVSRASGGSSNERNVSVRAWGQTCVSV